MPILLRHTIYCRNDVSQALDTSIGDLKGVTQDEELTNRKILNFAER